MGEPCPHLGEKQTSLLHLFANGGFLRIVATQGTQAELLLAFWPSIGFKPGDFMTTGMSEQRAARLCRAFNGVTHRASLTRFSLF